MARNAKKSAAAPLIAAAREQLRRWRRFQDTDQRNLVAIVAAVPLGLLREDDSPEAERAAMLELAKAFEAVAPVAHAGRHSPTPAVAFAKCLRAIVGKITYARASLVARHARRGRPTTAERDALNRRAWDAECLLREMELVIPAVDAQQRAKKGTSAAVLRELLRDPGRDKATIARAAGVNRASLYEMKFDLGGVSVGLTFNEAKAECIRMHGGGNGRDGIERVGGELADVRRPDGTKAKLPRGRRRR